MPSKQVLILLLLFSSSFGLIAQEADKYKLYEHTDYNFPYQLGKPDKSWELPDKLIEISGLSFIDEYTLACIQDEKGNIYIFNL